MRKRTKKLIVAYLLGVLTASAYFRVQRAYDDIWGQITAIEQFLSHAGA